MGSNDRDGVRAALGLNDRRNRAEEILLLQGVNQTLLIFIRDKVAAIGVGADFQHILYVVVVALADVVPEGRLVCLGSDAGLVVRFILRTGFAGKWCRGRGGEHLVDLFLTLQTLNVVRKVSDFLFHLVVGRGILCGNHAAVLRVCIQE